MIIVYCAKCKRPLTRIEIHEQYMGKGLILYLCCNCVGRMRDIIEAWIDGAQITITWQSLVGDGANTDSKRIAEVIE